MREMILNNFGTKLVSVLIAVVLWMVVLGSRNVETTKEVMIEVITPDGLVVANDVPDRIAFRIAGPKAFLRAILDRRDPPIKVDLSDAKAGPVTYRFFSDNIRVPIGVKVLSVNPTMSVFRLEPERTKRMPVKVAIRGTPPEGYEVVDTIVEPKNVTVRGAKSRVANIAEIQTTPIDVSDEREAFERPAVFDLGQMGIQVEEQDVRVRIKIRPTKANYRIRNVRIRVLADHEVQLSRRTVTAAVRASLEELKTLNESDVYAQIDLKGKPKGVYRVPLQIIAPKHIGVVEVIPDQVNVTLR